MAREFLRVIPEAIPGTFDAAGIPVILDIDSVNAYTLRPVTIQQTLNTAGAHNRRLARISKKTNFTGNLNFTVRGSHGPLLANWCTPTFAAGNATIKSYSIDHCMIMEDTGATKLYDRKLGVYVQQAQFTTGEVDQWFKAQLQLVGMKKATITGTDFIEPAITDYPSDPFITFEDATGGLTLHAATRMDIETFNLTIMNNLDVKFYLGLTPITIKWCGRNVNWTSRISLLNNTPRTDYEATTGVAGSITFNNGTNSLVFNMEAQNFYTTVTDAIDMSKVFLQELSMECLMDRAAGTDFSFTAT